MAKKLLSESQVRTVKNRRILIEKRLRALVAGYDSNLLREAHVVTSYQRRLVNEAIAFERAVILEAFSNMSTEDIADMYWHFKEAVSALLRSIGATKALQQFKSITAHGDEAMEMLDRGVDIHGGYKNKIAKVFTDVTTIVRGLLNLTDQLTDRSSSIGDALNTAKSIKIGKEESWSLLGALQTIDKSNAPQKKGLWGSLKSKVTGPSKGKGAKFREGVLQAIMSHAPGAAKLIDVEDVVDGMLHLMPEEIEQPFEYFSNTITTMVDDEQLADLTAQRSWLTRALGNVASDVASKSKDIYKRGKETVGRELGKLKTPVFGTPETKDQRVRA